MLVHVPEIRVPFLFLLCMAAMGAEPTDRTLRTFFMGSSLTDSINLRGLQELAESRGHVHVWGHHGMAGSPIAFFWPKRDEPGGRPPFGSSGPALRDHEWDAISLEPRSTYGKELEAALNYIDLAVEKSPGIRIHIFSKWPRTRGGSFDKQWLSPEKDIQNNNRYGVECFVEDLRQARPGLAGQIFITPVGHTMHLLDLKCRAGLVPGMRGIYDGYNDGSHQGPLGKYIVGCTFFATLYRESPVGLPTEPYGDIPADIARVIQETAWEAVNAHPRSGVAAPGPLRVITPFFPPATVGEAYSRELHASFGRAPFTWSLVAGSLPEGLTIDPSGAVAGTPAAIASERFTVQVVDAGGSIAERELSLAVEPDSKPTIPEQALPLVARGDRLDHRIAVEGGNGDLAWRLASVTRREMKDGQEAWVKMSRGGKWFLPTGIDLGERDGTISGSPGSEGIYRIRVLVEDGDAGSPDVAEREPTLQVGPVRPETWLLPAGPDKPRDGLRLDGVADESFWRFDQPLSRISQGAPRATAMCAAAWSDTSVYVAVKVIDAAIHEQSESPWLGDSIEVFLDLENSREAEYNANHRRIVITPSGDVTRFNLEEEQCRVAASRTADGWCVELVYGLGQYHRPKDNWVYAFDVALNDDIDGGGRDGQRTWRGPASNDVDSRGWGTVICSPRTGIAADVE